MGNIIRRFWVQEPAIATLFHVLGGKARLVGGCVRDALLNGPIGDIDIATSWVPDEVIEKLTQQDIKVIPTGLKHGTVTAVIDHKPFEITTLRKDVSCDGRHADVEFTDNYEEDASRRDFTFNAMSCDLDGNLYDYFGGEQDLYSGLVKFVGEATVRCQEDYLRVLRFFRFYAWFGKNRFDEPAIKACGLYAKGIEQLSGERIQKEMLKLLAAYNPITALQKMQETKVLAFILGSEVKEWEGLIRQIELEQDYNVSILPLVRLAHIIKDLPSPQNSIERWKLSNQDTKLLHTLTSESAAVSHDIEMHYPLIRHYGRPIYIQMLRIQWALNPSNDKHYRLLLSAIENWKIPHFPLTGKDLQALGITPGKAMGESLKRAEGWWEAEKYMPDKIVLVEKVRGWVALH